MIFNTFFFIWFFPIVFVVYYILQTVTCKTNGKKVLIRNIFLLFISYFVYIRYNPSYALVLLGVTITTYIAALIFDGGKKYSRKGSLFGFAVIIALMPLLVFKYSGFASTIVNDAFSFLGINIKMSGLNWAIPLGISFFTLQSLGYMYDVYAHKIHAEKNFITYSLFVSFFPQIVSGPISKASDLMPQLRQSNTFNYPLAVQGLKWLLWGCFLKIVVADRLGLFVDVVFNNYQAYSGSTCMFYAILYAFQIYTDFAGYSFMAIGTGALLGFRLQNNFNRPYLSSSVTEFWHRWHISLSLWLKDYIYIPLGGNRCSKLRNYVNILVTFLVSGIWHGANWTFIVWGLLQGIFQVLEKFFNIHKRKATKPLSRFIKIIITFVLVDLAWVFFKMPSVNDALSYILLIFTTQDFVFNAPDKIVMLFVCIVVAFDILDEYCPKFNPINTGNIVARWSTYALLLIAIALFGVFDSGQFIYARF